MPWEYLKLTVKLIYIEILGILIIICALILSIWSVQIIGDEYIKDYTECLNEDETAKCKDAWSQSNECYCFLTINITQPMNNTVTAYYELETFDQSPYSYSRDNKQLSGELSSRVSEYCEPYDYVTTDKGRKPIAPCGGLADRMFNDTLILKIDNDYVPFVETGLIPEDVKKLYRNPSKDLQTAFKDYAKPINWRSNIWELDTTNLNNNGFQNEAFMAWMNTDWKRKPLWRLDQKGVYQDGLPKGVYVLCVNYAYPPSFYSGRRIFIISNQKRFVNYVVVGFVILLLCIGLSIVVGKIYYNRKKYGDCVNKPSIGTERSVHSLRIKS